MSKNTSFFKALQGSRSNIVDQDLMLYGQFVGSWEGIAVVYKPDGLKQEVSCEVLFEWILGGEAIQDIWIAPSIKDRSDKALPSNALYGTTIRMYNRLTSDWEVVWINPHTNKVQQLKGKRVGDDIVQEYISDENVLVQWIFTDITSEKFHWIHRMKTDDSWIVISEFFMCKI